MPVAAPRSILFASVTAEEQGCSFRVFWKTFAGAAGKIMVDLNFDDVPPLGTPEEVEVSGAERTTFYPVVQATARTFIWRSVRTPARKPATITVPIISA